MKKIVKEISGLSPLELALMEKPEVATSYQAEKHDPWKTVYIVIENAHDCYGETHHGYYESYEDAERTLEIFCKTYGGRIEQTTWGEIERIII